MKCWRRQVKVHLETRVLIQAVNGLSICKIFIRTQKKPSLLAQIAIFSQIFAKIILLDKKYLHILLKVIIQILFLIHSNKCNYFERLQHNFLAHLKLSCICFQKTGFILNLFLCTKTELQFQRDLLPTLQYNRQRHLFSTKFSNLFVYYG